MDESRVWCWAMKMLFNVEGKQNIIWWLCIREKDLGFELTVISKDTHSGMELPKMSTIFSCINQNIGLRARDLRVALIPNYICRHPPFIRQRGCSNHADRIQSGPGHQPPTFSHLRESCHFCVPWPEGAVHCTIPDQVMCCALWRVLQEITDP